MSIQGLNRIQLQGLVSDLSNSNWEAIGKFVKEGFFAGKVWKILGYEHQSKLYELTKRVNLTFQKLEEKGVKIFDVSKSDEVGAKLKLYQERLDLYFQIALEIQNKFNAFKEIRPELKKEYTDLEFNVTALKHRLSKSMGGIASLTIKTDFHHLGYPIEKMKYPQRLELLKSEALAWKKKQPLAINKNSLGPQEIQQLEEAARYGSWVTLLVQHKEYKDDFFNWALRDGNRVDIFIMYRNIQKTIKTSLSAGLIGRIRKFGEDEVIKYQDVSTKIEGIQKRILIMPIYSGRYDVFEADKQEWVNILNPDLEVDLKVGNYKLKLKEIWKDLSLKNDREAKVNFCKWGLINFHPGYFDCKTKEYIRGYWDADKKEHVNYPMNKDNWMQYVPPGDVVSNSELEVLYGEKIKDQKIFFKVSATRQSPDLNALKCHGFLQPYIYMGKDKWKVVDLGFFAYRFQQSFVDGLWRMCATEPRVLVLIDQNGGYSQRQKASFALFPNEEQRKKLLDRMFDLTQFKGVFQFAGENCSHPIQTCVNEAISDTPNFFRVRATRGKVGFGLFDSTLAFLEKCPELIRRICFGLVHLLFGSYRTYTVQHEGKTIQYSVAKYYRNTEEMYHPGYLHYQIEKAYKTGQGPFVNGELSWGNLDDKLKRPII